MQVAKKGAELSQRPAQSLLVCSSGYQALGRWGHNGWTGATSLHLCDTRLHGSMSCCAQGTLWLPQPGYLSQPEVIGPPLAKGSPNSQAPVSFWSCSSQRNSRLLRAMSLVTGLAGTLTVLGVSVPFFPGTGMCPWELCSKSPGLLEFISNEFSLPLRSASGWPWTSNTEGTPSETVLGEPWLAARPPPSLPLNVALSSLLAF